MSISEFARQEAEQVNTKSTNPKDGVGSGKPDFAFVPRPVLFEVGAAMREGALKYGGFNWRIAGVRTSVYLDAADRHLCAYREGQNIDPDSGVSHLTKAIAGLMVLRDAEINGMVQNDDRPPSCMVPWLEEAQERVREIDARYPEPVHSYTQREVAHKRDTPVHTMAGRCKGYDIEVMLPADGAEEGFVWAQQGETRDSLDHALAIAQALRDDGYGERVIRIVGIFERVEEMLSGELLVDVSSPMRKAVHTIFPGDPSLMEMSEEEALEAAELERNSELEEIEGDSCTGCMQVYCECPEESA